MIKLLYNSLVNCRNHKSCIVFYTNKLFPKSAKHPLNKSSLLPQYKQNFLAIIYRGKHDKEDITAVAVETRK